MYCMYGVMTSAGFPSCRRLFSFAPMCVYDNIR